MKNCLKPTCQSYIGMQLNFLLIFVSTFKYDLIFSACSLFTILLSYLAISGHVSVLEPNTVLGKQ